jgi:hypothetical protein
MADTTIGDALLLLSKVSSSTDKRLSLLEKVIGKSAVAAPASSSTSKAVNKVAGKQVLGPIAKKEPRSVVEKPKSVIVTDFGKKAESDLKVLQDKDDGKGKEEKPGKDGGGMSFIKKLIGPALLVLGGIAALVTGLMTDGPLKGLLALLSKGGIIGGIKLFKSMATKQIGKFTGLFAKILPKNMFGSLIKSAKGFLGGISKFLLKPFAKLGGKAAGKGIFGAIGKLFGKFLKPILGKLPGIGTLISFGFAFSRFKKGDLIGGLIEVASGIASLVPGVGTGISVGLGVLNAFLDVKKGGEEKVKPKGGGFKLSGFFGKIKDKIMNNYPIKNLVQMWDGAKMVFSGDIKGGLTEMAYAIPFMKPLANFLFSEREEVNEETGEVTSTTMFAKIKEKVMSTFPVKNLMQMWSGIKKVTSGNYREGFTEMAYAVPFMKPLANFLFSEREEVNEETGEVTKKGSLFSGIKTAVMGKLKAFWKKAPKWLKWGAKKVLPDNIISVLESEGEAAPEDPTEAEAEAAMAGGKANGGSKTGSSNVSNSTGGSKTAASIGDKQRSNLLAMTRQSNTVLQNLDKSNRALLEMQVELLNENIAILREIAQKTGGSANIITNNTTSVTNMNNQRNLRDVQEMYT